MKPLATEPLVVLASASPIVGELLGEKRIVVCHSATGYASGPRRMSAHTRGIERHPRRLTDPLFAAYTDATVELRASPHATASGAKSALSAVSLSSFPQGPLRACALATTADASMQLSGRHLVGLRFCIRVEAAARAGCHPVAPRVASCRSKEAPAHPLARQRGGRPPWRDTAAESRSARAQRRSCGREGRRRPRTATGATEPGLAKTVFGRVARDTSLRRSLRSLRPCPATGPARHRPMPLARHESSNRNTAVSNKSGSSSRQWS